MRGITTSTDGLFEVGKLFCNGCDRFTDVRVFLYPSDYAFEDNNVCPRCGGRQTLWDQTIYSIKYGYGVIFIVDEEEVC